MIMRLAAAATIEARRSKDPSYSRRSYCGDARGRVLTPGHGRVVA